MSIDKIFVSLYKYSKEEIESVESSLKENGFETKSLTLVLNDLWVGVIENLENYTLQCSLNKYIWVSRDLSKDSKEVDLKDFTRKVKEHFLAKELEDKTSPPIEEEDKSEEIPPVEETKETPSEHNDLVVSLKYLHQNYINNLVVFFKISGIRCEEYYLGNKYLIWNGESCYFTISKPEECEELNISNFTKEVLFTEIGPKINSKLSQETLELEQPSQQTSLIDNARQMIDEAKRQGVELGIGEDGLFTFKILMTQTNKEDEQ